MLIYLVLSKPQRRRGISNRKFDFSSYSGGWDSSIDDGLWIQRVLNDSWWLVIEVEGVDHGLVGSSSFANMESRLNPTSQIFLKLFNRPILKIGRLISQKQSILLSYKFNYIFPFLAAIFNLPGYSTPRIRCLPSLGSKKATLKSPEIVFNKFILDMPSFSVQRVLTMVVGVFLLILMRLNWNRVRTDGWPRISCVLKK